MVQSDSSDMMASPNPLDGAAVSTRRFPNTGAQHPRHPRDHRCPIKHSENPNLLRTFFMFCCLATIAQCPTGFRLARTLTMPPGPQGDADAPKEPPQKSPPEERCAINLFGLPRAFQSLVLPSLIQNVIRPNAAHNCDYFVHYFNLTQEAAGRSGEGGHLNPSEILLLEQHVQREAPPGQRRPNVVFFAEHEEDFRKKYDSLIKKTRDTKDSKGRLLYFPWGEPTYTPETVDNIIKMWHSIQAAWLLMERHATGHNVHYSRVAMLRSDVMYVTPMDIYRLDNDIHNKTDAGVDLENRYAVVPNFSKYPVNDRMIYGPHAAVKIWAAERFARLETHVQSILKEKPGFGMHSERFLSNTIFPAIRQAGFKVHEHPHMCFFRVRVDESVWVSDCKTRAEPTNDKKKKLVERLIGRQCGSVTQSIRSINIDCKQSHES
jgi:hypothetical protein